MEKRDFKKELKKFYAPKTAAEIVTIPAFSFLMVDGEGATGNAAFQSAIETLFAVSYTAKFMIKKGRDIDYGVMPLEGLWWAEDMDDFVKGDKDKWKWTLMIMQPDIVTEADIGGAKEEALRKKKIVSVEHLRFETFEEGLSAHIMHKGPFSEEHATIVKMHSVIKDTGGEFDGKVQKHHEIYLNDFRKIAPANMKTILRQPFRPKD